MTAENKCFANFLGAYYAAQTLVPTMALLLTDTRLPLVGLVDRHTLQKGPCRHAAPQVRIEGGIQGDLQP